MKKIITILLVLATVFSLFACEEFYTGPVEQGGNDDSISETPQPPLNDDPTDDFTVSVMLNGQLYSPRMPMDVYWSDGFSVHVAPINKQGVARIDGLDGDYKVTLSAVPNEYCYEPNNNITTNDKRNITIDLYPLNRLSGSGTGIYSCYKFNNVGVYTATIDQKCDKGAEAGGGIFFQFAPPASGTYTIESWIDVTADNINPYVDVYNGSTQYKYYVRTTDDGGAMGSYTINFVHTVQIAAENISSSGGGQAVYTFAVKAESKNNKYPINVTFAVKRNGGFELSHGESSTAISNFDFSDFNKADHEYSKSQYKITNPEVELGNTGVYVFDGARFKVYEKDEGGDGFYHLYDEVKYADNDGYGPIVYAYITKACRYLDVSFNRIEYDSDGNIRNNALTCGGTNYKHFIEGYTELSTLGSLNGGTYYCANNCPCHDEAEGSANWACPESAECECLSSCRKCPDKLIGFEGYQAYANSDGLAPVTEELAKFLTAYSASQRFFFDGEGDVELGERGPAIQAYEGADWLFACCYYEPIN